MDDKTQAMISNSAIDMYESLRCSIEEAGGSFDKDRFLDMKVEDLIAILCTNKITFRYDWKEKIRQYKKTIEGLKNEVNNLELRMKGEISSREHQYKDLNDKFYKISHELICAHTTIEEQKNKTNYSNDINSYNKLKYNDLYNKYSSLQTCINENNECMGELKNQLSSSISEIEELKRYIFQLENSLAHSYSAEEVTEKIDRVLEVFIEKFMNDSELSKKECNPVYQNLLKLAKGNWKYNL